MSLCPDYYSFVVSFEIGKRESSKFILIFQNGFWLFWVLAGVLINLSHIKIVRNTEGT